MGGTGESDRGEMETTILEQQQQHLEINIGMTKIKISDHIKC